MQLNFHIKNFIIPIHFLAILGLFLFEFNIWFFLLGWFLIYGCGLVTGFHKLLSHNSFKTHKIIKNVLTYLGCLGISGSPIWWVAIHRGYHHADTEGERDLQTPRKGLWSAYLGWQFGTKTQEIKLAYAKDLLKDKFIVDCHKNYRDIVWATIVIVLLISPTVCWSLLILPMIASHHGENLVNLLGHSKWFGYRTYKTTDDTVNNPVMALLTWGQHLHNNHHAKPNDVSFAKKWWEIDLTMPIIWIIRK